MVEAFSTPSETFAKVRAADANGRGFGGGFAGDRFANHSTIFAERLDRRG